MEAEPEDEREEKGPSGMDERIRPRVDGCTGSTGSEYPAPQLPISVVRRDFREPSIPVVEDTLKMFLKGSVAANKAFF